MSKERPQSIWGQLLQKWGYMPATEAKEEEVAEETTTEVAAPSRIEIEAHNEKVVEEHILPEPEQVATTATDYLEKAQVGVDTFEEVIKEMPDADPTPRPEEEAVLTAVEVKSVKAAKETKKKGGRPKKNTKK